MTENPEMMVHFRREEAVARYTGTVQYSTVQYCALYCALYTVLQVTPPGW